MGFGEMKKLLLAAVSAAALMAPAACSEPAETAETERAPAAAPVETAAAPAAEAPAHEPIVWDLTDLYASPEAWEAERQALESEMTKIADYKGTLGDSAQSLADALDFLSGLAKRAAQLYVYASLKADEDTRIQENLARRQLGQQLFSRLGEETAWTTPEILSIGADTIEAFIAAEPRLEKHAFDLHDTLRAAPHTLSEEGERILAAASLPLGGAQRVYSQMSSSDIPWPTLMIDGEEVRIDNQGYVRNRQNPDRAVRKQVFDTFFGTWDQYGSAIGQALAANTEAQVFTAKMRDYDSAREAALFSNALPVAIYDQLIAQVHAGLPTLHRYFKLRGRMLGVDDLQYYDIYPELVSLDARYSLEDSKRITLDALKPFGEEYLSVLRDAFDADWMHAYPQEGKRSGAYVFGIAYDVHPYVLLNHQEDYNSLSTFAHEWGHAVHSVLSNANQPWETASYATFVAEMASTINEVLLLRTMQANAETDEEKLFFLGQELEQYRGTFFRQAMFGEFESEIHAAVEAGEPLTGESLTAMYQQLLEDYHGQAEGVMTIDPAYAVEWAYIPHFYYDFYVFQYATSIAASTAFAERLLAGEEGAQTAVIDMLKSGGSAYPHQMFVDAGVDLTTPGPYQAVFARMNAIMDEMEAILDASGDE